MSKEKHKKRRAMLAKRAERAKLWLVTDDKPKQGIHPVALQDIRQRWIYRQAAK